MWENRCKVAVSGVGFSQVTRSAEIPLVGHALTAVKEAVADSGLQMSDIDGLATYPELPATGHAEVDGISIVSVNCMMAMLKLPNLGWHIQVGTTNIGGAVQQAVNALLAGVCRYAVVWRAMHNPRGTYQNLPSGTAAGATQFTAPYGFGGPGQGMAVAYTRWLERNNQNREKMATLAVTQRKHTQHNPHAYFYGTKLTREDYLHSRMVAYPFCLFDCDIPVQGAVAIVLTTADRARDLKPRPAYLAGYGQRLHFEVAGRIGSLSSYMEGGSSSAKLTWERSGFGPKDVDVAQIYDGFSASVIYGLEILRFLRRGRGARFHPGRPHRARRRIAAQHLWRQPRHRAHPRPVAYHRGRLAGFGPRRLAPSQGRQRVIRRRQRPDRDRHDLHLRARAVLTRGRNALCRAGATRHSLFGGFVGPASRASACSPARLHRRCSQRPRIRGPRRLPNSGPDSSRRYSTHSRGRRRASWRPLPHWRCRQPHR